MSLAPQIGFDRFIQIDWVVAALRVRAGLAELQQLEELIDATHAGSAAKKKTRTVLNRLWLEPRDELVAFADRGVEIYRSDLDTSVSALAWGMAIAAYPFFGKVAEIVGRLTALQGDCASAEVHRRMAEKYGEREGTRRMTNMVLQSQASWGAIDRTQNGKRLIRKPKITVHGQETVAWIIEACVRYAGRPISLTGIDLLPIIYPFELKEAIGYVVSSSSFLELRSDSGGRQIADVRERI